MATSDIQICNNALLRLGASTITSFDDGTTAANACNQVYEQVRDALLRMHTWNFALTRVALAADSAAPSFEYSYQYTLPSDFIRVQEIYQQNGPYRIEGQKLVTDMVAPLNLVYVSKITDPTQFDPLFVEVLTLLILVRIGPRIAGAGFNPQEYMAELNQAMLKAQLSDSQDSSPKDLDLGYFTDGRYSGSRWWGW